MRTALCLVLLAGAYAMGGPVDAGAQDSGLLAVGEMAPDLRFQARHGTAYSTNPFT